MRNLWKRTLALVLAFLCVLACVGCGEKPAAPETTAATKPAPTEPEGEAEVLKVLTLGHSLAVNATRMLNLVAHAEGYKEMKIGTLYYSGCPLYRHVEFLTNDSPEYALYISSTETPDLPPEVMESVTMLQAIKFDYWDIIIMQGGVFELAKAETFTKGDIQTIQKYVNDNKLNPNAVFGWHLPWAFATDPAQQNDNYANQYKPYNNDRRILFEAFCKNVEDYILPDETFTCLIPSGAAVENAISSHMKEGDILCDYAHAGDFGRLIAAYAYYCTLAGIDKLEEIKVDAIPKAFVKTSYVPGDRELTEADKALILESVNNALAHPLEITQSQYKEAPEGYIHIESHDG